ncbi:MAG: Rne/Rng family ribonuclease [Bryobacteraceae bacterium]
MTKEMIISANRHETKIAILEEEQLVEIFFQRGNEYSLAGSIHKGRVTRVLPGMQSAFVDLGLERDAFLYVSDFLEEGEGEDYEKIVAPAERAPAPPVEKAPQSTAPALGPATPDQDGRERGGRRSRRRRQRDGHGFPESKYSHSAPPAAEVRPAEEPVQTAPEDIIVLPGESLAKYRSREAGAGEEYPIEAGEETESGGREEVDGSALDESSAEPEPEPEFAEAKAYGVEEVEAAVSLEEAALAVSAGEAPSFAAAGEPPRETETEEAAAPWEGPPGEDVAEMEAEQAVESDQPADEEVPPAGEEPEQGFEGQRIVPLSLTAQLRDQGMRSMHRAPRRMRRRAGREERGRGPAPGAGTPDPQRGGRPHRPPEHTETADRRESKEVSRPDRPSLPSIADLLKEGQEIVVQIAKEPLGQKGARITSHIALPGRFVVFMPMLDHMGVSRKVGTDEERHRLKRILLANSSGMTGGFIVRTAAEGRSEAEIAADMNALHNLWLDIRQKAERRPAPCLLHADLELVQRVVRDQVSDQFRAIWVDSEDAYENTLGFVERFQPAMVSRVKLYTRSTPIYDAFNITTELEKALRPKVWLKSGGYIVINQTEALVAIDVNTGKYVGKSHRLEDTIVKTNLEAVKEIARQMRLRDLGGIIVVDFIDMDERKSRQKVMQAMEEAMRSDKAPYKILQFNDFGLVAITRKRVKQSLERALCSPCPYCEGAGYVKGVQTIIGEILTEAQKVSSALEGKEALLRVHPEVAKVLKSREAHYIEELEEILRKPVLVTADPLLHHEKFDLT